jgi:predicted transcriptional regulator
MAKEKFDYSRYTTQQLACARLMADPDAGLTNKEIAEQVGVTDRTIYRWKEDEEFVELVNYLADRYMDSFLSEVYGQLQKAVKKGSVKAIELALKRSGKLIERREVTSDVNVEVVGIESKTTEQILMELRELERRANVIDMPTDKLDFTDAEVVEVVEDE